MIFLNYLIVFLEKKERRKKGRKKEQGREGERGEEGKREEGREELKIKPFGTGCWLHQEFELHLFNLKDEHGWQTPARRQPEVHLFFSPSQTGCHGDSDNHKLLIATAEGVGDK